MRSNWGRQSKYAGQLGSHTWSQPPPRSVGKNMIEKVEPVTERKLLESDTLSIAIRLYRRTFEHAVPSSEFKTAAIMGAREELARKILLCVLDETPNAKWANEDDPFAHKCFDNGLLV